MLIKTLPISHCQLEQAQRFSMNHNCWCHYFFLMWTKLKNRKQTTKKTKQPFNFPNKFPFHKMIFKIYQQLALSWQVKEA